MRLLLPKSLHPEKPITYLKFKPNKRLMRLSPKGNSWTHSRSFLFTKTRGTMPRARRKQILLIANLSLIRSAALFWKTAPVVVPPASWIPWFQQLTDWSDHCLRTLAVDSLSRRKPNHLEKLIFLDDPNLPSLANVALCKKPFIGFLTFKSILPIITHHQIIRFFCYVFLWDSPIVADQVKRVFSFIKCKNPSYCNVLPLYHFWPLSQARKR